MNLELIQRAIESPTDDVIQALLDDESTVFWVDWREEDAEIVEYCESIIQSGELSADEVDADNDAGFDLYINYRNQRVRVPLEIDIQDRHITLVALNEVLAPDYEIRFCIDSNGADTLAFAPLRCSDWKQLADQFGTKVSLRFYQLQPRPNVFTDALPF